MLCFQRREGCGTFIFPVYLPSPTSDPSKKSTPNYSQGRGGGRSGGGALHGGGAWRGGGGKDEVGDGGREGGDVGWEKKRVEEGEGQRGGGE